MTSACFASAPGSVMLTGEHAVVYGHPAIVCAIEQRVTVQATPLSQARLEIHSSIAPSLSARLDDLPEGGAYRFVLHALKAYPPPCGLRLNISSDIDPTLGLGSSAAVTIATLGVLATLSGANTRDLHTRALAIIRQIQGRGSGADLAASLTGGMIAYRLNSGHDTAQITALPAPPALSLRYAGYKTPTAQVLSQIAAKMQGHEAEFKALYNRMGGSAGSAIAAAKNNDWPRLASELNAYQILMEKLGVCDATLAKIIKDAQGNPGLMAAKISGSGLGDCVLAMGEIPAGFSPAPLAEKGLIINE
ncbi:MAG TPA: mevalonate kinase [Rhodobacteraceae bacterium]|nr:mevalonate kinase [Paracoccaceae bacterium]